MGPENSRTLIALQLRCLLRCLADMGKWVKLMAKFAVCWFRGRRDLALENLGLRQQLGRILTVDGISGRGRREQGGSGGSNATHVSFLAAAGRVWVCDIVANWRQSGWCYLMPGGGRDLG